MKPGHRGFKHLMAATGYSLKGLQAAWHHEAAFRQEIVIFILAIPLALWIGQSALERLALIGVWLWVIIVELLNSAIEAVVDRIGEEYHELSGRAKDLGSAAVMLSLLLALSFWGFVLWQNWGDF